MQLRADLVGTYLAAIAFQVLFPLAVAIWVRRRIDGAAWRDFGFGAVVFFVSQILTRLPATQLVQYVWRDGLKRSSALRVGWASFSCVTAGLFEETGRYLGYRLFWRRRPLTWQGGVMYGVGHGGLESMLLVAGMSLLGLINVIALSSVDFGALGLDAKTRESVEVARAQIRSMSAWMPLLGAIERAFSMAVHVALSLIVLQGFLRGRPASWLLAAIGYHTLSNLIPVLLLQATGRERILALVGVEAVIGAIALVSLLIARRLCRGAPPPRPGLAVE